MFPWGLGLALLVSTALETAVSGCATPWTDAPLETRAPDVRDPTFDAEAPTERDPTPTAPVETAPRDTGAVGLDGPLCFPGPLGDGTTCLHVVPWEAAWGPDWVYATSTDPRYPRPTSFLDLDAWPTDLPLAPNFALGELGQAWKGRWALLQPHLVVHLQAIRDAVGGPVTVNSGYRNPAYNASVGGATWSRHTYGDAADLGASVSLDTLAALCEAEGAGYIGWYEAHVHCDWRDDPPDPVLFGSAPAPARAQRGPPPTLSARLVPGPVWTAPAEGWDEGEPLREWTARDAAGALLTRATGRTFTPPPGTATVEVWVGRAVRLTR